MYLKAVHTGVIHHICHWGKSFSVYMWIIAAISAHIVTGCPKVCSNRMYINFLWQSKTIVMLRHIYMIRVGRFLSSLTANANCTEIAVGCSLEHRYWWFFTMYQHPIVMAAWSQILCSCMAGYYSFIIDYYHSFVFSPEPEVNTGTLTVGARFNISWP